MKPIPKSDKPKKVKKAYEPPLKINGTFENVINVLVSKEKNVEKSN